MASVQPYRLFDIVLTNRTLVSPSIAKLTFTGSELDQAITLAADQCVKLFFPLDGFTPPRIAELYGHDEDWYAAYRKRSKSERPAMRTYTIRDLRSDQKEIDIEFVLHGVNGPASRWATEANIGDAISLCAPNKAYSGELRGYEWKPPQNANDIILIADETALPAAMGIIEGLEKTVKKPRVRALLEVPLEKDIRPLPSWIDTCWLPRETLKEGHGEALKKALRMLDLPSHVCDLNEMDSEQSIDLDKQILWESSSVNQQDNFYVWLASESKACLNMRRYLINERCIPKRLISSMGYWREGKTMS